MSSHPSIWCSTFNSLTCMPPLAFNKSVDIFDKKYFLFSKFFIFFFKCFHLIRSDVPLFLIQFALDELQTSNSNINIFTSASQLPGSSSFSLNYAKMSTNVQNQNNGNSTSEYADLTKLYCVVSTLLRCYDLSAYSSSSNPVIII